MATNTLLITYDGPSLFLISVNVVQMVAILFILLPFFDYPTLSKYLRQLKDEVLKNPYLLFTGTIYLAAVLSYGIFRPVRTLNYLRISKSIRDSETPKEKLIRIIHQTNATRDYLLGGFSLFFMLVSWRLYDFITFSAKLTEFSILMANYDIVDISGKEDQEDLLLKHNLEVVPPEDEELEEEESDLELEIRAHWPSVAELPKKDIKYLKKFLKAESKKTDGKETSRETQTQTKRRDKRRSFSTKAFKKGDKSEKVEKLQLETVEKAQTADAQLKQLHSSSSTIRQNQLSEDPKELDIQSNKKEEQVTQPGSANACDKKSHSDAPATKQADIIVDQNAVTAPIVEIDENTKKKENKIKPETSDIKESRTAKEGENKAGSAKASDKEKKKKRHNLYIKDD